MPHSSGSFSICPFDVGFGNISAQDDGCVGYMGELDQNSDQGKDQHLSTDSTELRGIECNHKKYLLTEIDSEGRIIVSIVTTSRKLDTLDVSAYPSQQSKYDMIFKSKSKIYSDLCIRSSQVLITENVKKNINDPQHGENSLAPQLLVLVTKYGNSTGSSSKADGLLTGVFKLDLLINHSFVTSDIEWVMVFSLPFFGGLKPKVDVDAAQSDLLFEDFGSSSAATAMSTDDESVENTVSLNFSPLNPNWLLSQFRGDNFCSIIDCRQYMDSTYPEEFHGPHIIGPVAKIGPSYDFAISSIKAIKICDDNSDINAQNSHRMSSNLLKSHNISRRLKSNCNTFLEYCWSETFIARIYGIKKFFMSTSGMDRKNFDSNRITSQISVWDVSTQMPIVSDLEFLNDNNFSCFGSEKRSCKSELVLNTLIPPDILAYRNILFETQLEKPTDRIKVASNLSSSYPDGSKIIKCWARKISHDFSQMGSRKGENQSLSQTPQNAEELLLALTQLGNIICWKISSTIPQYGIQENETNEFGLAKILSNSRNNQNLQQVSPLSSLKQMIKLRNLPNAFNIYSQLLKSSHLANNSNNFIANFDRSNENSYDQLYKSGSLNFWDSEKINIPVPNKKIEISKFGINASNCINDDEIPSVNTTEYLDDPQYVAYLAELTQMFSLIEMDFLHETIFRNSPQSLNTSACKFDLAESITRMISRWKYLLHHLESTSEKYNNYSDKDAMLMHRSMEYFGAADRKFDHEKNDEFFLDISDMLRVVEDIKIIKSSLSKKIPATSDTDPEHHLLSFVDKIRLKFFQKSSRKLNHESFDFDKDKNIASCFKAFEHVSNTKAKKIPGILERITKELHLFQNFIPTTFNLDLYSWNSLWKNDRLNYECSLLKYCLIDIIRTETGTISSLNFQRKSAMILPYSSLLNRNGTENIRNISDQIKSSSLCLVPEPFYFCGSAGELLHSQVKSLISGIKHDHTIFEPKLLFRIVECIMKWNYLKGLHVGRKILEYYARIDLKEERKNASDYRLTWTYKNHELIHLLLYPTMYDNEPDDSVTARRRQRLRSRVSLNSNFDSFSNIAARNESITKSGDNLISKYEVQQSKSPLEYIHEKVGPKSNFLEAKLPSTRDISIITSTKPSKIIVNRNEDLENVFKNSELVLEMVKSEHRVQKLLYDSGNNLDSTTLSFMSSSAEFKSQSSDFNSTNEREGRTDTKYEKIIDELSGKRTISVSSNRALLLAYLLSGRYEEYFYEAFELISTFTYFNYSKSFAQHIMYIGLVEFQKYLNKIESNASILIRDMKELDHASWRTAMVKIVKLMFFVIKYQSNFTTYSEDTSENRFKTDELKFDLSHPSGPTRNLNTEKKQYDGMFNSQYLEKENIGHTEGSIAFHALASYVMYRLSSFAESYLRSLDLMKSMDNLSESGINVEIVENISVILSDLVELLKYYEDLGAQSGTFSSPTSFQYPLVKEKSYSAHSSLSNRRTSNIPGLKISDSINKYVSKSRHSNQRQDLRSTGSGQQWAFLYVVSEVTRVTERLNNWMLHYSNVNQP